MATYSEIPAELAEFLHRERGRALPFLGAGVSVGAGVPAAEGLAILMGAAAREEGVIVAEGARFAEVCRATSGQLSHLRLQQITAEIISGLELRPTPLQKTIVRAPTRVIVTTNFDGSLSLAATEAGLTPVVRTPNEARALELPEEGQVVLVHLHGHVSDPAGMALPGESMEALATNEAFKVVLRGLVVARAVVYLGYRLPPEDEYLHAEIETLAEMFSDRGPHRVLLPAKEFERRRAELARLEAFGVTVDTFDSSRGYQALEQAALLIAPGSTVEGEGRLPLIRDRAEYYLPPTLLPEDRDRDRTEPDSRLVMATLGFTEATRSPGEILECRRAVVMAEPGMGKTQLLYHLGEIDTDRVAVVVKLTEVAARLDDDEERTLAAALARGRVLTGNVAPPSRDALDGNAYTLLFDALDEVGRDQREAVVALLIAVADRYPQHVIVITTRVTDDVLALEAAGFEVFRIPRDGAWGRRYLEHRGIPDERVTELFADVQTVTDLVAVPQYAALIGERLAQEPLEGVPSTGFGLMIEVGVKDAVRREAGNLGYSADQLYRWLRLLALSLELRGRVNATIDDLAEIPGPEELRGPEARERLVERALLQDIPNVAALQTNAVQEALAADALLSMGDPVEALKEAAVTTLVGHPVFRADLDHMIDLFYEGAPTEIRPALRDLDKLRWARTARADAPAEEREAAIDELWEVYVERRVWLDTNQGREVRDARSAARRLIASLDDVGSTRRTRWRHALQSREPTTRANATFFMSQLGFDEETTAWLEPLFGDDNPVVRRHAVSAALSFGQPGQALLPALRNAYPAERDELAAEAIGHAIFELTAPEERAAAIELLLTNPIGWGRNSYLIADLELNDALAIFERTGVRNDSDERQLSELATKQPVDEWTDHQVQILIRILMTSQRFYYREFRERELLEELASRHPEAAIAAVREAAPNDVNWNDLSFLEQVPRETLQAAAEGRLEAPLTMLIEILELREAPVGAPPRVERAPAAQPPSLAEIIDDGSLERRARGRIPRPLLESYTRQVDDLSADQRDTLAGTVGRLWPEEGLQAAVKVEGGTGTAPASLEAALAFSTALDLPLEADRWLEIFETKSVFFWWDATNWLRRHSQGIDEGRVIAALEDFETEFQVRQALSSLDSVSDAVADAAATALIRINAVDSIFMLREFRERGQLQALRRLQAEAEAPEIRRAAQRELAAAGEAEAQRRELEQMRQELAANPGAYGHEGFPWAESADPEIIDDLERLLRQIAEAGADFGGGLDRSLRQAFAATGDERAIAAYDAVIEDAGITSSGFFRYQRDELARRLSRDSALKRLPEPLAEVAQWAIDRGLEV
jgi:hypothetical protein